MKRVASGASAAKAAGCGLVLMGTLIARNTVGFAATAATVNTSIRAFPAAGTVDGVVDYAADSRLSTPRRGCPS